jgi:predicted dehydrogenase
MTRARSWIPSSMRWGSRSGRRRDILSDPDVHAVLIHPKSYLMADWAIEAMEAGKAVLCEKPAGRGSVDTVRLVEW